MNLPPCSPDLHCWVASTGAHHREPEHRRCCKCAGERVDRCAHRWRIVSFHLGPPYRAMLSGDFVIRCDACGANEGGPIAADQARALSDRLLPALSPRI